MGADGSNISRAPVSNTLHRRRYSTHLALYSIITPPDLASHHPPQCSAQGRSSPQRASGSVVWMSSSASRILVEYVLRIVLQVLIGFQQSRWKAFMSPTDHILSSPFPPLPAYPNAKSCPTQTRVAFPRPPSTFTLRLALLHRTLASMATSASTCLRIAPTFNDPATLHFERAIWHQRCLGSHSGT